MTKAANLRVNVGSGRRETLIRDVVAVSTILTPAALCLAIMSAVSERRWQTINEERLP